MATPVGRLGIGLLLVGVGGALGVAWWASREGPAWRDVAAPASSNRTQPAPVSRVIALPDAGEQPDGGDVLEVVSAEDGRPLSGAVVELWEPNQGPSFHHYYRPPAFHGETSASGRVSVPPQTNPQLKLNVRLDFFLPYRGPYVPGTRVVLEPVPLAHGRVLSAARTPVGGATITSVYPPVVSTRSAADGTFSLRLSKVAQVMAEQGGAVALSPALDLDEVPSGDPLELVLQSPTMVPGRVVGRDGGALPGVTLTASVGAVSWRSETDAEGVFFIPSLDGPRVSARFEKPGYVTVERGQLVSLVREIVMSHPSRLEGVLVDQRGHGLPGVDVVLAMPGTTLELERVETDGEGRFVFEGLEHADAQLEVLTEDEQTAQLYVRLPEGETTRVKLALRPPLEPVTIDYRSSAGVAVGGCAATGTPVPEAGWSTSTTLADELELRRGRFHFVVRCDDGRGADEQRDIDPAEGTLHFVVRSDAGEVFDDEQPAEPVLVRVITPSGEPLEGAEVECFNTLGVTGPDGRYRCEVHAADAVWPVHVRVSHGGARGLARATGKEKEVQVVLRSPVTLRGRVDGALPAGPLVLFVRSALGDLEQPLVGNTFAVEGQPVVRTFLCVQSRGQTEQTLGCAISESGEEVVIPLGDEGQLTFSALNPDGSPLLDVVVYVDRVSIPVVSQEGLVTLFVPPGDHVLVLNTTNSRARAETRFTVRAGQPTSLGKLRLEDPH